MVARFRWRRGFDVDGVGRASMRIAIAFSRSGENAFFVAEIVTSRLSLPKISTIPSIARNENVPDGSSGKLFSTTSSSTSPAGSELATNALTSAKVRILFITTSSFSFGA
jgi:hypothetical protein